MTAEYLFIAKQLRGLPVDVAALDALAEPGRSIARRLVDVNGNGPEVFKTALDELVKDPGQAQDFYRAVFAVDPLSEFGPGKTGTPSAAYAGQSKTLAEAYAPRRRLPFVVEGLLPRRSLTLVFGAEGSLKSAMLADLCLSLATGTPWLSTLGTAPPDKGIGTGFVVNPCTVLWVDADNGEDLTAERLAAFGRAYHAPNDAPVHWLSFPTPPIVAVKGLQDLTAHALEIGAGLIVIDNLLRIAGAKDENSSEMDTAMGNLRRLAEDTDAAVIVIHHRTKDRARDDGLTIRGHSSIPAAPDSIFLVNRPDDNGKPSDTITIKQTKARRKPVEPFAALWTYELGLDGETLQTARFWRADLPTSGKAAKLGKAQTFVLRYLHEHGGQATVEAIMNGADACSPQSARQAVYSLTDLGKIRRVGTGGDGKRATYELQVDP
jgi:hypothetical protein